MPRIYTDQYNNKMKRYRSAEKIPSNISINDASLNSKDQYY
jgi:hypothetical protein